MIYDTSSEDEDCWMEVQPPSVVSPVNGTTGVVFTLGVTITSNAFQANLLGITLAATDYELWTGPNGTGTLVSSGYSIANLSVIIPGLAMTANTTYHVRVRHRTANQTSMWSNSIQFTTAAL